MKPSSNSIRLSFMAIGIIAMITAAGCADGRGSAKVPLIDGKVAKFVTESQVLIVRKVGPAAGQNLGQNAKEDILATQLVVLRSPVILNQVIEHLKKTDFGNLDVDALQARLQVQRDQPNGDIVRLTWYGNDEKEGPAVLMALVNEYKGFLIRINNDGDKKVVETLTLARDQIRRQLVEAERRQLEFVKNHPFGGKSEVDQAASVAEKTLASEIELGKAKRRLENFDQHQNDEIAKARAKAWALKSGYPPTTEKVEVLYRDYLKSEVDEKRQEFDDLKSMRDEKLKRIQELAGADADEKRIAAEVARSRLMFDAIVKQLAEIDIRRSDSGFDVAVVSGPVQKAIGK